MPASRTLSSLLYGALAAVLVNCSSGSNGTAGASNSGSGSSAALANGTTAGASTGAGSPGTTNQQSSGTSPAAAGATAQGAGGSGTIATGSGTTSGLGATSGSEIADAGTSGQQAVDATVGPTDAAPMYDANMTVPTAGCGKAPSQVTDKYVQYNIMVPNLPAKYAGMYTARNYYVWLPMGYDPNRAYTTVFLGPGCGGNGSTVLPMQNASGPNAILVGLSPVGQCFMTSAADSPEIPFFDAVLSDVESSFCIDKAHVFIAGFSSGSWLSNLIGCARAGIVRAQGNATGGLPPVPMCTGPIAAMLAHDEGDPANSIDGGEEARDRILAINGCSMTQTVPYDAGNGKGNPMCVQYQNCPAAYPVVWCPTTGQGHSDQVATGLSVPGFWNFWESLPYVPPPQ